MLGLTAQLRTVLAVALLASAFAAGAPDAMAQERSFDIPAQSLSGALVEYSRQSGDVVVAPADLVAGKTAPAVRGIFTTGEALDQLLARSGIAPRRGPDGGVILVAADAAASPTADRLAAPAATFEELVVTSAPLGELTQTYARSVAAPPPADPYPRWNASICPGVAGLSEQSGQALVDHIAWRAFELDVRTERSGCRPNIVIVFASDAEAVAREIVESRLDLLGYAGGDYLAAPVRGALEEFVASPRPVRWWHVSTAVAPRFTATRLRRPTHHDINFALMVVDMGSAGGAPSSALADYIAMAALAQIDPGADMSRFSSILNLFAESDAGEPPPAAMTRWDEAYLHALYESRAETAVEDQRADIAQRMARAIASQ